MAPDDRFIMTDNDREELRQGFERADQMKAKPEPVNTRKDLKHELKVFRIPERLPEPNHEPIKLGKKIPHIEVVEVRIEEPVQKMNRILKAEEDRKRRREEQIAFLLKEYRIDTKKVDEK